MAFIDIVGAVVANTVYVDNNLVAKDVEITLPEVAFLTADVDALGTLSLPIRQRVDNMTAEIGKIGVDRGLRSMLKPEPVAIECRFVQDVTDANGSTTQKGCKAFIKGIAGTIPGITATVGEASSNPVSYTVLRYQLFIDGQEAILIDRLAGIVRIGGKNYTDSMASML